jgi:hypothetical protein
VTRQTTFESISFGSRYQPEMEAAAVMSLPEGSLIVFSRGLRHIAQDSRNIVVGYLKLMPGPPQTAQISVALGNEAIADHTKNYGASSQLFW